MQGAKQQVSATLSSTLTPDWSPICPKKTRSKPFCNGSSLALINLTRKLFSLIPHVTTKSPIIRPSSYPIHLAPTLSTMPFSPVSKTLLLNGNQAVTRALLGKIVLDFAQSDILKSRLKSLHLIYGQYLKPSCRIRIPCLRPSGMPFCPMSHPRLTRANENERGTSSGVMPMKSEIASGKSSGACGHGSMALSCTNAHTRRVVHLKS